MLLLGSQEARRPVKHLLQSTDPLDSVVWWPARRRLTEGLYDLQWLLCLLFDQLSENVMD